MKQALASKTTSAPNQTPESTQSELDKQKRAAEFHFKRANEATSDQWKMFAEASNAAWKLTIIGHIAKGEKDLAITALLEGPKMSIEVKSYVVKDGEWSYAK